MHPGLEMMMKCFKLIVFVLPLLGIVSKGNARAAAVPFDTHNGYFVSNKFEPDAAASFVAIGDQKGFDNVFGTAMVMGDRSHRLPANAFESKMVVAAIKRGKALWQYRVEEVTVKGGVLRIRYTATSEAQPSAEFACPLIISVPRGNYRAVEFVENGKLAKRIDMAAATQPSAAAWAKLYADEDWYRERKVPEKVFTGTLERVAQAGGVSILMRAHRYKLGDRALYPADENAELEKLVGKKVEIRGKPYDVELEGQAVREIWPGAVRPANDGENGWHSIDRDTGRGMHRARGTDSLLSCHDLPKLYGGREMRIYESNAGDCHCWAAERGQEQPAQRHCREAHQYC